MIAVRELALPDLEEALRLPGLAAPEHLYVANELAHEVARLGGRGPGALPHRRRRGPRGRFVGAFAAEGFQGLLFLGAQRLFVLGPCSEAAAGELAAAVAAERPRPRVGIGPRRPMAALLARLPRRPRLARAQPFLAAETITPPEPPPPVRPAALDDVDWLIDANLQLNAEDLGIDPARVDRTRLRIQVENRLLEGRTRVLVAGARPVAKLEIGQRGPFGALIEGVYTEPAARGRGFARALVAASAAECLRDHDRVGLHVGRTNAPALAAYRAAGFREAAELTLALFD